MHHRHQRTTTRCNAQQNTCDGIRDATRHGLRSRPHNNMGNLVSRLFVFHNRVKSGDKSSRLI